MLRERWNVGRSSGNLRLIIVCFMLRMIQPFPITPMSGLRDFKNYMAFTIKMIKASDLSSSRCGNVIEERIGAGFGAIRILAYHRPTFILVEYECY